MKEKKREPPAIPVAHVHRGTSSPSHRAVAKMIVPATFPIYAHLLLYPAISIYPCIVIHSVRWVFPSEIHPKKCLDRQTGYTHDFEKEDVIKGIEKFDEKVGEGAAKAKSSVSGWFGSSK